ncbi:hypothetical protein QBC34DRAFT_378981 [Podospora aff. communis PSN243]|uniref:Uncharacterized protein n=1 Tax=Podospora aff. communis PSN243 TaxID=3040156 RepID=A0AAV9GR54_9PEZI|nr:hypothetical protein QBC34DRAFT_378981 [Podospora aff. communis PSN243]
MEKEKSQKRKRAPSSTPTSTNNPFSNPPSTLEQFTTAGLSSDVPLPSSSHPSFPHRPIPSPQATRHRSRKRFPIPEHDDGDTAGESTHGEAADGDDEATATEGVAGEDEEKEEWERKLKMLRRKAGRLETAYRAKLGVLSTAVRRFLGEGDIDSAARAFGLLARATVDGKEVDLRMERYWELGAEILMREAEMRVDVERGREWDGVMNGEGEGGMGMGVGMDGDGGRERGHKEEGRERVATFYASLVRQHPWNESHQGSVSSLEFHQEFFGCQMERVHAMHARGLERVEDELRMGRFDWGEGGYEEEEEEDADMDEMDVDGDEEGRYNKREARFERKLRRAKDKLQRTALARMRELENMMDKSMMEPPFSTYPDLWRLKGMVSLYIADLCMPLEGSDFDRIEEGGEREKAGNRAKEAFMTFRDNGGEIEEQWILDMLEENGGGVSLPMFSSLPMQ